MIMYFICYNVIHLSLAVLICVVYLIINSIPVSIMSSWNRKEIGKVANLFGKHRKYVYLVCELRHDNLMRFQNKESDEERCCYFIFKEGTPNAMW